MFNKIDRSNLIPTTYELKKIIPHVEYSIVEAEIPLISMKELGEEAKFKLFGHADTYFGKIFLLEYFNGTAVEIWKAHLFRGIEHCLHSKRPGNPWSFHGSDFSM